MRQICCTLMTKQFTCSEDHPECSNYHVLNEASRSNTTGDGTKVPFTTPYILKLRYVKP